MFSIIVPTYNRVRELRELLVSLQKQTRNDFEVIICDDGSTDNTSEVVSQFIGQLDINYLVFENSGGPAYPRNRGIEVAKYDWICFLDSDDLWTDNKLEILASVILKNDNKIYCHPVYLIDDTDKKLGIIGKYKRGIFLDDFKSLLYNGSQVVNSSLCVKREILTPDLYYNTDKSFHAIEDYIFILNLTHAGHKIKCISENLGYYRVHQNNLSSDLSSQMQKWRFYFSHKPYKDIDYQKVESLLSYIGISSDSYPPGGKVMPYFKIIFGKKTTIELRAKSSVKLILQLFTLSKKLTLH